MRALLLRVTPLLLIASPLLAQGEGEAAGAKVNLLSPNGGLMFWTLLIFVILLWLLARFAFKPLTRAVEAREKALEEAIVAARRDRDEAAALLAEQKRQLEAVRAEAQQFIADGRQAGEKIRAQIVDGAREEQQQMLDRARREIQAERDQAVEQLRREAVELAVRAAGRVIDRNLDDAANRRLVEDFLGSMKPAPAGR